VLAVAAAVAAAAAAVVRNAQITLQLLAALVTKLRICSHGSRTL